MEIIDAEFIRSSYLSMPFPLRNNGAKYGWEHLEDGWSDEHIPILEALFCLYLEDNNLFEYGRKNSELSLAEIVQINKNGAR